MKIINTVYLFLGVLFIINSTDAFFKQNLEAGRRLAVGSNFACAIDDEGIKCAGHNQTILNNIPKNIQNPRQIVADRSYACVLDQNGVQCWGSRSTKIGQLKGIQYLFFIEEELCVFHQHYKVSCVGQFRQSQLRRSDLGYNGHHIRPSQILHASKLDTDGIHSCALIKNKLKCWGGQSFLSSAEAGNIEVTDFSMNRRYSCIIQSNKLECFGENHINQEDYFTFPKALKNPRFVAIGFTDTCVLDDTGIKCIGSMYEQDIPRNLENPWILKSNKSRYFCTIDNNGLHCWKGCSYTSYSEHNCARQRETHSFFKKLTFKSYSLTVGDFKKSLKKIKETSNVLRYQFIYDLEKISQEFSDLKNKKRFINQQLLWKYIGPLVLSNTSKVYQEDLIAKYLSSLKRLKLRGILPPLPSKYSEVEIQTTLKVIDAVAKNAQKVSKKKETKSLIYLRTAISRALQKPTNIKLRAKVLSSLKRSKSSLQALSYSTKTKFLYDIANLAFSSLKSSI